MPHIKHISCQRPANASFQEFNVIILILDAALGFLLQGLQLFGVGTSKNEDKA